MLDYRGKRVRVKKVEMAEEYGPQEDRARRCVGEIGTASSVYKDGRYSHDESYLVEMADGFELNALAEELELVD